MHTGIKVKSCRHWEPISTAVLSHFPQEEAKQPDVTSNCFYLVYVFWICLITYNHNMIFDPPNGNLWLLLFSSSILFWSPSGQVPVFVFSLPHMHTPISLCGSPWVATQLTKQTSHQWITKTAARAWFLQESHFHNGFPTQKQWKSMVVLFFC